MKVTGVLVALVAILSGFASGVVQDSMGSVVQVVVMKNVSCSGVVWDRERVLTAAHCIPETLRDALEIRFRDGTTRKVDVERIDDGLDLAILKFPEYDQAKPVRLAFSVLIGSDVFVVGHVSDAVSWVVTHGVISGILPQIKIEIPTSDGRVFGSTLRDIFLTDAVVTQRFSGGGWFDEFGRLLAIHVMTFKNLEGNRLFGAGVGYTTVREWVERR
jgi:S1-C subfamily serine protease